MMDVYSSVWKHELLFIQSIDWNSIREADSQMKLLVGESSCACSTSRLIGGVIVKRLVFSSINGPRYAIEKSNRSHSSKEDNRTYVQPVPNSIFHWIDIVVASRWMNSCSYPIETRLKEEEEEWSARERVNWHVARLWLDYQKLVWLQVLVDDELSCSLYPLFLF